MTFVQACVFMAAILFGFAVLAGVGDLLDRRDDQ